MNWKKHAPLKRSVQKQTKAITKALDLKNTSKNAYFSKKNYLCKNNLKATWKIIGSLGKTKGQTTPQRIVLRNNKTCTDNDDIVARFNKHFVNMGPSLASKIEDS